MKTIAHLLRDPAVWLGLAALLVFVLPFAILFETNALAAQVPSQSLYTVHSQGRQWTDMTFVKEVSGRIVFTNSENKALIINGSYFYYEQ